MSDAVEVIREDEAVPVESPQPPQDDLDSLLAEYDSKVGPSELPAADNSPLGEAAQDAPIDGSGELDALLREFDGPSPDQQRIEQLTGELNSVRTAELERQARADFEGWSTKLQQSLDNPNVGPDFARTTLLAMSVEQPALEAAWRYRHLTNEQRRAADVEFQQLEFLYNQAQQAPNDPRKAQALAQMEQRGQELALMMNSHKILTNAWRDVQKRASKVTQIDPIATADHDMVAQAVRDGAGPIDLPETPVRWGSLSAKEGRERVLRDYGFDPGWSH